MHACDARVKIALLLTYSVSIFFVGSWWGMAAFALVLAGAMVLARIPVGLTNRMLVPVYVLAAFSVLFNVVNAPGADGLAAGLFLAVRMVLLVAASFVVCLTSSPSALVDAFVWFITPLRQLKVPVDDIAFTLGLALRFIPLVEREFHIVRTAQMARGAQLAGSFSHRLRIAGAAFAAMFVSLFRRADTMSQAMDSRCFGASSRRTKLPR